MTGRYLAVYEVDDADVVTNPEYMAQPMSEWAEVVMATWTWSIARCGANSTPTELSAQSSPSARRSIGSRMRTMPR